MTTHAEDVVLDLDALVRPVGHARLDGTQYPVLPVQGEAMAIFEQITAEAADRKVTGAPIDNVRHLDLARRIVAAVAPGIPEARVKTLAIEQLTAIIGLSMGKVTVVRSVMAAAGKGGGSTKTRPPRTRSGRK